MSIPKIILTVAAAGGLTLFSAGAAGASSSADSVKTTLDEHCVARGGLPVTSPYSIARCQGARANKGFDSEQAICEGADGRFIVTVSTTHMNRATWACIATSPAA